jgi:hypothetical protein
MDHISPQDLRYLARMNERVTDPDFCQCPGCRLAGGDIPPMSAEDTFRLEKLLHQVATIALAVARAQHLPEFAPRAILMDRIRAACLYSYMFGVDNARGDNNERTT